MCAGWNCGNVKSKTFKTEFKEQTTVEMDAASCRIRIFQATYDYMHYRDSLSLFLTALMFLPD